MTERRDRRRLLSVLAVLAVLAAASGAVGADGSLELGFGGSPRPSFRAAGRVEAPRGTLVLVSLAFDGELVAGSGRRVELAGEGLIRLSWEASGAVLPGEYEVVATIESSRQPRTLRGAFPGAARVLRAHAYVGEPEADVADEEALRRALLAE